MINQIISHQKSNLFLNFANIKGCTAQTHCVLQHNLRGLLPHAMSSDSVRNPIGRRTETDRTANGNRSGGGRYPAGGAVVSTAPTEQTGTFARLMHFLLGWCAYCSVGALETSAPPKRHQHLCRSMKSVGLILSKSEFRGSCWQGVLLSQLHQQSRQARSLGWCTSYSVGALETSAHPKRHQHLCRSVKSVGLILSKSEFRGSCWQGVLLSQLHQQSKRREYSHRIRGTHRTVWRRCASHRLHRFSQIRRVWHPCHTHAANSAP